MEVTLLFPHQLFSSSPALARDRQVFLYEDPLFFTQYTFHKHKLILHRASMKYAAARFGQQDYKVEYLSCQEYNTLEEVINYFGSKGITTLHTTRVTDYLLHRRLKRYCSRTGIEIEFHETPMFLLTENEVCDMLDGNQDYFMARFYRKQRKHLDILIDGDGPAGGKWSFDKENRKKFPESERPPEIYIPRKNKYVQEATDYVNTHFSGNPGNPENFFYPVTYHQADKWLEDFLENRMSRFGDYEDALHRDFRFLHHSLLTPALNTGLLTPGRVLEKTFEWHAEKEYPLNSLEGFVRQITGWREFIRGIYLLEGVFERTNNHFNHHRKLPASFWTGETGILPVDDVIRKVLKYGYAHHIERLMVLGNFMLLCEFDPDEVYQWFMQLFVDACDWVMVPNVYGMILYADGGLFATKPYISGSNYIRKMSNYKKGDWCEIWDGLYWRFLHRHRDELAQNHRMSMVMSLLDKMDNKKLRAHCRRAEKFLDSLG